MKRPRVEFMSGSSMEFGKDHGERVTGIGRVVFAPNPAQEAFLRDTAPLGLYGMPTRALDDESDENRQLEDIRARIRAAIRKGQQTVDRADLLATMQEGVEADVRTLLKFAGRLPTADQQVRDAWKRLAALVNTK